MSDATAAGRRLDRLLAGGSVAAVVAATVTLGASLFVGVGTVATTAALYYALVVPVVVAGALVVAAMLTRAALVVGRWRGGTTAGTGPAALLRAMAFAVELAVIAGGVVAVGWGFAVAPTVAGPRAGAAVAPETVVFGLYGLFVVVVGCLPVVARSSRRARRGSA
jgi:hypothetical protein